MITCYIGDSLTLGYGDETGLGWSGRIASALRNSGVDTTSYNLGVRKDTTTQMQHRWRTEAMLRKIPNIPFKLVFSFGVADVVNRVNAAESLAAGIHILTQAKEMGDVMLIGPTPTGDPEKSREITQLSGMFSSMCEQLAVPFVPTIDAMHDSSVYEHALRDGDGVHPTASGYAKLAEHIMQSQTARTFFGLE